MKNKIILGIAVVVLLSAFGLYRHQSKTDSQISDTSITPTISEVATLTPSVSQKQSPSPTSAPTLVPSSKITLTISSPASGSTVSSSSITVRGKTSASAEVFVNESETKADSNGNFSVSMKLDEGDNYIIVIANDADGNVAEAELTVTYNP
jgi:hypothetical protein